MPPRCSSCWPCSEPYQYLQNCRAPQRHRRAAGGAILPGHPLPLALRSKFAGDDLPVDLVFGPDVDVRSAGSSSPVASVIPSSDSDPLQEHVSCESAWAHFRPRHDCGLCKSWSAHSRKPLHSVSAIAESTHERENASAFGSTCRKAPAGTKRCRALWSRLHSRTLLKRDLSWAVRVIRHPSSKACSNNHAARARVSGPTNQSRGPDRRSARRAAAPL